jgi:hypothetical protein
VGSVPILGAAATRDGRIAVIEQGTFHAYADEDFRGNPATTFTSTLAAELKQLSGSLKAGAR